jgi:hypothetical protein
VELTSLVEPERAVAADLFTPERRYEQRFPQTTQHLALFVQGYERSRESALAILTFLEQHFAVNTQIGQRIRELCGDDRPPTTDDESRPHTSERNV